MNMLAHVRSFLFIFAHFGALSALLPEPTRKDICCWRPHAPGRSQNPLHREAYARVTNVPRNEACFPTNASHSLPAASFHTDAPSFPPGCPLCGGGAPCALNGKTDQKAFWVFTVAFWRLRPPSSASLPAACSRFNASAKDLLLAQGVPDRPAVFGAAAIAGFFAAFFSLPCARRGAAGRGCCRRAAGSIRHFLTLYDSICT